ncbi:hypothetical protein KIW84_057090 [Lathyrus oleraceus]|uniref:Uncharacterized protein n=1 Tax=Pisum sativum TaxID=3888 RepID=A0A9D4X031_PEA|nr:hypothetical protein KIW84_057090 [Pisum sativum]
MESPGKIFSIFLMSGLFAPRRLLLCRALFLAVGSCDFAYPQLWSTSSRVYSSSRDNPHHSLSSLFDHLLSLLLNTSSFARRSLEYGTFCSNALPLLPSFELVVMNGGLVLGTSLAHILKMFPVGILGVLLLFPGIELAMCARDMNSKEDSFVALICTAVSLVGSSAALGFLVGMIVYGMLKLRNWSNDKPLSTIWNQKSPN